MFSVEVIYFGSYAIVMGGSALTILMAKRAEKVKAQSGAQGEMK